MKAKFTDAPGWGVTRTPVGTPPSSVYVAMGAVLFKDIPYTMTAHPRPQKIEHVSICQNKEDL